MKQKSGITLIALIITIIILLIIAGITIYNLIGNGFIEKTDFAAKKYEYEAAKELIIIKLSEIQTECLKEQKEYNLEEIIKQIENDQNINIDWIYNNTEIASINSQIEINYNNIEGVVLSSMQYKKYKFLIGKNVEILGFTTKEISKNIADFPFEVYGVTEAKKKTYNENISVNKDLRDTLNTAEMELELEDLLTSKTALTQLLKNSSAIDYILKDKECLEIINNNQESLNLLIQYSKKSKEQLKTTEETTTITDDNNKISLLMDLANIEQLELMDIINSQTGLTKLCENTDAINTVLTREEIFNEMINSPNIARTMEKSNNAMKIIINNEDLLNKYNKGTQTTKLTEFTGNFNATVQYYIVPETGTYKIQCWGARGGYSLANGDARYYYGKGGYAYGEINLQKDEILYVYVGGHGADARIRVNSAGGWNGRRLWNRRRFRQ